MNTPFYKGVSILGLNKKMIYEIWYDYVKPKYMKKQYLVIWV